MIEGERYLDYRRQRKKLPCEVYNSSLKRLENGKRIDRHLCEDRSKGRICYSLTESRLQEMEIKLRENRVTYFLIIFSELYDASPQYPLNDGVIKYFLEEENIDLSVDKLVEMGRSGITTLYKPVQYIQVVKEEHNLVVSPKQNKWDLKYTKEEHYYYRIIGLSTSDLVEHRIFYTR